MRNLLTSLLASGKIETTLAKAKELKGLTDRFISRSGQALSFSAQRKIYSFLTRKSVAQKFTQKLRPGWSARSSGFVRVIKLGQRFSDGSERARVELVEVENHENKGD